MKMVISCLTIYAIAFSCVPLMFGRSYAATPLATDMTVRPSERKSPKMNLHKTDLAESVKGDDKSPKILQSSYLPLNDVKTEKLSDESIRRLNKSHAYFALFDPVHNMTEKFVVDAEKSVGKRTKNHFGEPIKNFVAWDTLQDSEREVRVHYNGITAKETVVRTGADEKTGKRQGLRLRQLTDGKRFIQLIYTFDNQLQDCEYIRQKKFIQKFLSSFKDDIEKAKATYEHSVSVKEEDIYEDSESYDDFIEEDEGKIERFNLEEDSEEFEGEDLDLGKPYRNVTFQIIRRREDLPQELSEWMNYPMLKAQCKENHKLLRKLAYDRKHGDENAKKLAEEHIERIKRGLSETYLIFPGTKWCGQSHIAEKYTTIGGFSKTDRCCRTHDHCPSFITSFEQKYGMYNFRPFTLSHCRCDSRRKRDIMDVLLVPGTKWCGKGRRATKYTSLGGFSRTDKCCRVHDTMCPHWIGSMEKKYGLFNWRINTIMHCRCDKRFRACLKMAKTGTANFVGKLFFNVVQTKCFVLKPQEVCLKYSWWGKCEKKEYRKKAYLKDNLSY